MGTQYDKFLTSDNFLHAWKIIRNSDRFDVKDRLSIEVFAAQTETHIDILVKDIDQRGYEPEVPHFLYQAKRDRTHYPLTFLKMYDRLVYQAIGNVLLQEAYVDIFPYLNKSIFGHVPQPPDEVGKFGNYMFLPYRKRAKRTGQYPLFISTVLRKRDKFSEFEDYYEISSDITSFYPSVDHTTLVNELWERGWLYDEKLEALLLKCLSAWASRENGEEAPHGLPIGYETSDLLSTIMLLFLDEKYLDYSFIRYVDDMYLFVQGTEDDAMSLMEDLKSELKKRKLTMNEVKSKLRPVRVARDESVFRISLPPANQDEPEAAPISEDNFFQLYTDFSDPCNTKIIDDYGAELSYVLYRLRIKNRFIRDVALCMLTQAPRWVLNITTYLAQFFQDEEVISTLFEVVRDNTILASVRLNSIRALVAISGFDEQIKEIAESWLTTSNDWYLRYDSLDVISDNMSYSFLRNIWETDNNVFVKCKALRIGFDIAVTEEQKIEVINHALQANDNYLQALGIFLWRRVVDISRTKLVLKKLKRGFQRLYLSQKEQELERYFFGEFYILFDFKLNLNLPIHQIFPEGVNGIQYLVDASDAKSKNDTYVKAIYEFTFYILLFVAKAKDFNIIAYNIAELAQKLDFISQNNVAPLRSLRYKVEKAEPIHRREIDELYPPLRKLLALNFVKIHDYFGLEIPPSLQKTYEEYIHLRNRIFISYAREDKGWHDRLKKALMPRFRDTDFIKSDANLKPGAMWKMEIQQDLDRTKIAVLLTTVDFGASDFITKVELPTILKAARNNQLTVVWLQVGYCDYKALGLSDFQCVNDPEKPLAELTASEQDKILVETANFIYDRFHGKA